MVWFWVERLEVRVEREIMEIWQGVRQEWETEHSSDLQATVDRITDHILSSSTITAPNGQT